MYEHRKMIIESSWDIQPDISHTADQVQTIMMERENVDSTYVWRPRQRPTSWWWRTPYLVAKGFPHARQYSCVLFKCTVVMCLPILRSSTGLDLAKQSGPPHSQNIGTSLGVEGTWCSRICCRMVFGVWSGNITSQVPWPQEQNVAFGSAIG